MPDSQENIKSNRRRPNLVVFIMPLFFGLLGFFRLSQRPEFELYRTMDVIQLLTSGACLGAALTGVMFVLLHRRS